MASVEHCLYCFEALASQLERRKGLSFEEVQKLWSEYATTLVDDDDDGRSSTTTSSKKQHPALQRLADLSNDSASASSGSSMSVPSAADTPATSTDSLAALTETPLFVTWNTVGKRSGRRSLRGCIGTFEPQDLDSGLSEYALTSALHDTRFPPVEYDELPSLEVAVTLLTDFEDADDAMDWVLGVHGLRIRFVHNGRPYGATYLPDVAAEQGWTKEETIVSLMRKAGWMGRKDKWRDVDLKVVRYQGKKESLVYGEYESWREWVDENKGKS